MVESIAPIDNKTIIFYEPVTWGMVFDGKVVGSGFTQVPGQRREASALSFHYYCATFGGVRFQKQENFLLTLLTLTKGRYVMK